MNRAWSLVPCLVAAGCVAWALEAGADEPQRIRHPGGRGHPVGHAREFIEPTDSLNTPRTLRVTGLTARAQIGEDPDDDRDYAYSAVLSQTEKSMLNADRSIDVGSGSVYFEVETTWARDRRKNMSMDDLADMHRGAKTGTQPDGQLRPPNPGDTSRATGIMLQKLVLLEWVQAGAFSTRFAARTFIDGDQHVVYIALIESKSPEDEQHRGVWIAAKGKEVDLSSLKDSQVLSKPGWCFELRATTEAGMADAIANATAVEVHKASQDLRRWYRRIAELGPRLLDEP